MEVVGQGTSKTETTQGPPACLAPVPCLHLVPLLIPGALSKTILPDAPVQGAPHPSSFFKQGEHCPSPLTDTLSLGSCVFFRRPDYSGPETILKKSWESGLPGPKDGTAGTASWAAGQAQPRLLFPWGPTSRRQVRGRSGQRTSGHQSRSPDHLPRGGACLLCPPKDRCCVHILSGT